MRSSRLISKLLLALPLFLFGGGIVNATDVTNTVGSTTYTFTVGTNNTVTLSQIGDIPLASYTGTDIDLAAAYPDGTFTVDGTTYTITSMVAMGGTSIATVKMPPTVTSLPSKCFDGCSALTTIDPVNIKNVTDKYGISKRDLALHAMSEKGTFPAGRAYIYAPASSGAKFNGFTLFYSNEPLTDTPTGITKGVTILDNDKMADDSYYDLSG